MGGYLIVEDDMSVLVEMSPKTVTTDLEGLNCLCVTLTLPSKKNSLQKNLYIIHTKNASKYTQTSSGQGGKNHI